MSHSTVLVIGPDHEAQLAPFDENLEVEPYPKPEGARTLQDMIQHYRRKEGRASQQLIAQRATYDEATGLVTGISHAELQHLYARWSGDHELRIADRRLDGHSAYVYLSTYNPRSRWDWYSVGGRWTGFYTLKPGRRGALGRPGAFGNEAQAGTADQCLKGDVDVEAMRDAAEAAAAKHYDAAQAIIAGRTMRPWSEFLKEHDAGTLTIDEARARYHAQAVVQAFGAAGRDWAFAEIEPFLLDRETRLRQVRDGALTTFAVLQDGEWHERGKMGWFGCIADEQDANRWAAEYNARFDALSDDTLLTIVDVHI